MRGHTCRRSGLKTRNDCSSRQLHVVLVTLHGPPELPPPIWWFVGVYDLRQG